MAMVSVVNWQLVSKHVDKLRRW